jgi:ectoine hydroxylase-related dioxygenase (phytanoyl-CoA dioxygenase family)
MERTDHAALSALDLDLDSARAEYEERGHWSSPVLFDADEVSRFLAGTERVCAGEHRLGRAPTLSLPPAPSATDLRKIDNAWWADPDLAALATSPILGTIAAALLGAPAARLWQDQLLVKPPGGPVGSTIGWHQDWASWDTVADEPRFVTAWVAFDDVDEGNGAMQMLPGSHTWGLVAGGSNFFATDRDAQLDALGALGVDEARRAVPTSVILRAGQVSFHHPLTFHGSGPNTSDRMRRSLAIHFVADGVTAVSREGIWQHYNLAAFLERGGQLGEPYRFDDLCPLVAPASAAAP